MIGRQGKNRRAEKNFKKVHGNKKSIYLWAGGIAILIAIMLVSLGYVPFLSPEGEKGKSFYVQGGETRPVLDPYLFTGLAKSAYTAAKEYPKVLDRVYCYCGCDQPPVNHKSLLSCFTDRHGEG